MKARLFYLKLELKRACRYFPQMLLGAAALVLLMGAAALLAGKMLYGQTVSGRVAVGVVLPEDDRLAKKAVSMISSLDSVKSLCDFSYMEEDEAREKLKDGSLYAVMEVPEELIQGIMDGRNIPVTVMFPKNAGTESRIFKELTDAGAAILGAGQAGIYSADEVLAASGMADSIPTLEEELNRIFLRYSLGRMDFFRMEKVQATGDVTPAVFYGISAFVLALFFSIIPVCGYLEPVSAGMAKKLKLVKIGNFTRSLGQLLGLTALLLAVSLPGVLAAVKLDWLDFTWQGFAALALVCLSAVGISEGLFRLPGTTLGGVLLLFLAVTVMHFLAGGFLPSVFLPRTFRQLSAFLPSAAMMDGVKMMVTKDWSGAVYLKMAFWGAAGLGFCVCEEAVRR